jgi:transcriptional regulator with XRE-family HTH domain
VGTAHLSEASAVAYSVRPVDELLTSLARNLRRYRTLRGLSSSEVAQRSQIARATLSALESGRGNPTLDTLSAIAGVLGVGVPELVAPGASSTMAVIRATEEEREEERFSFRLLRRFRAGPCVIDLYDLRAKEGESRMSHAHGDSVLAHVVVHTGSLVVRVDPDGAQGGEASLGTGDYLAFTADAPHEFTAVSGEVRGTLLIHYPSDRAQPPVPAETALLPARALE